MIGGTGDITVHEVADVGNLKELCIANGGGCGGEGVNNAYLKMWEEILKIKEPIKEAFSEHYMEEYLDLVRDFEVAERSKQGPDIISVRVTRHTYGISVDGHFEAEKHDMLHLKYVNNVKLCRNKFDIIIKKIIR